MKVTIVIERNPFWENSASANRWIHLINGLSNLGSTIKLAIYGGYQSTLEANTCQNLNYTNGITVIYIAPKIIQGYLKIRYNNYIGKKLRERLLIDLMLSDLQNNEGIVWTDFSLLGLKLAVELKRKYSKEILFIEQSEFLDIHNFNKGNLLQRWVANRRKEYFEHVAFPVYNGMALMTQTLLNHYKNFPKPQPIFLHLPMTVDLERFVKPIGNLVEFIPPYIAFVGVMNDAKDGVSILIKAFKRIENFYPKLKVYLVGGWNYDTPVHLELIKQYGLENRVFWMKEYTKDKIPNIICNAELLVLPRPDSKQAQGGFPTKLGEYLATGNPVCATRVGEIPNYLIDNESVFFAEPGSVESFAEAMDRALSDSENANRVGLNGKRVAEREFNKDVQARKLHLFFEELFTQSAGC